MIVTRNHGTALGPSPTQDLVEKQGGGIYE